jgi:hypothetical protein
MRKILVAFLVAAWSVPLAFGQELKDDQRWTESISGGFSFPSSESNAQAFGVGLGGSINVGYRFDTNFALLAQTGYYQYNLQGPASNGGANLSYIPLMAVARYNILTGAVHPYFLLGAGVALNGYVLGSNTAVNRQADFLLAPGLGVLFRVADIMAVFAQGRVDLDFTPSSGLGHATDSPSIFVPLELGVGFFVI